MIDHAEMVLRLAVATAAGAAIGLNRDLKGKPAGLRTHALVALGSALLVSVSVMPATSADFDSTSVSRVIQGIVTGIGFLGGGVILKDATGTAVHGLTTAAAIWLAASLGMACGLGSWPQVAIALALAFVVLLFGGPVEQAFHRWLSGRERPLDDD